MHLSACLIVQNNLRKMHTLFTTVFCSFDVCIIEDVDKKLRDNRPLKVKKFGLLISSKLSFLNHSCDPKSALQLNYSVLERLQNTVYKTHTSYIQIENSMEKFNVY